MPLLHCLLAIVFLVAAATPSSGQSAENVVVVINEASAVSRRVGDHYIRTRKIPADNVIRINTTTEEQLDFIRYTQTIELPIAQKLSREGLHDRVLFIVLTKGVPLRITGTAGRKGTGASVDSELSLLYRRLSGRPFALAGPVPNPYYLGGRAIREAQPFTHRTQDIYLVTRLDGFSAEDAIALVDRAQAPASGGRIVLDQRSASGDASGDAWLREAAARLRDLGHGERVLLEDGPKPARDIDQVLGYYSWGSNDPQNRVRQVGMRFVPGALAATFVSSDARTFRPPPDDWRPTSEASPKSDWFAGSPQSLAGDLIREGVTGLAANVAEPFLDGAVRPDILFPAYLAGFTLAEAYYLALPYLSWQTVVLGDPLCAPFRTRSLTRSEIEDPLDPATELPGIFSRWRTTVASAGLKDVPPEAVALLLRADARLARGDGDGAREALEAATKRAPQAAGAQLQLAVMFEQLGEGDKAIERYRLVLDAQPNHVVALNNLAYALAVRKNALDDALPLAQRAVRLAPNNPTIIDTLAWIQHLRGDHAEAAALMTRAVQKSTGNARIHLNAAIVFEAAADRRRAETQLDEAIRLDPAIADHDDARALRARLAARP